MADPAQGTVFSWRATTISEIVSFTGPAITRDLIDVANLSSTVRPYIDCGVYDPGEVTLELNFQADTAIHDQLADDCISGTAGALVVTFLNGTAATNTYSCNAIVTAFTPAGSVADKLTGSVTIKGTGAVTIA